MIGFWNLQKGLRYDQVHIVDLEGLSGGLVLFWTVSYKVKVLHSDNRIINVKVNL